MPAYLLSLEFALVSDAGIYPQLLTAFYTKTQPNVYVLICYKPYYYF